MAIPAISAFWAGLVGLLGLVLAINVVRLRQKFQVGIGDGGHGELARAVRVFGNFAEYAPFCLVLLALLEMTGAAHWLIHVGGAALFVGRAAHAWGLAGTSGASAGRVTGMTLTWLVMLAASVLLVWTMRGTVI